MRLALYGLSWIRSSRRQRSLSRGLQRSSGWLCGCSNDGEPVFDIADHHRVGSDLDVMANRDRANHAGTGSDVDVVADCRGVSHSVDSDRERADETCVLADSVRGDRYAAWMGEVKAGPDVGADRKVKTIFSLDLFAGEPRHTADAAIATPAPQTEPGNGPQGAISTQQKHGLEHPNFVGIAELFRNLPSSGVTFEHFPGLAHIITFSRRFLKDSHGE